MPHVHSGASQSLVLLALLWTPLALFWLNRLLLRSRRWRSAAVHTRAALLLMLVTAIIHAALIADHSSDPLRATLFGLDSVALVTVFAAALVPVPGWRMFARFLLATAVGAYIYYVGAGWESVDMIGLFTKLVELTAILLLSLPDDPAVSWLRTDS